MWQDLKLQTSKTDQEGAGETLYVCDQTRSIITQYKERGNITHGAGFRHIRRGDHIQSDRLTPHSARRIIQKRAKPLAWKEGNIIFQLSTGRYSPAQSLIEGDKEQNHKAIALRPRGKELLQIITTEAEKGKPTLVVGPKDFTEEADLKHLPEIANLLAMPNVHVINHHHAEGVNQYDHCENAFIFLYEPRPDELKKIASRKLETSRKQSDMPPTDRFKDIGSPKLLVVINHVGAEYICFVFV